MPSYFYLTKRNEPPMTRHLLLLLFLPSSTSLRPVGYIILLQSTRSNFLPSPGKSHHLHWHGVVWSEACCLPGSPSIVAHAFGNVSPVLLKRPGFLLSGELLGLQSLSALSKDQTDPTKQMGHFKTSPASTAGHLPFFFVSLPFFLRGLDRRGLVCRDAKPR